MTVEESIARYRDLVYRFAEVKARIYEAELSGCLADADPLYDQFDALESELNVLSFLALTHYRIGQNAEAQACLRRLRVLPAKRSQRGEWWEQDGDVHPFVREAESVCAAD